MASLARAPTTLSRVDATRQRWVIAGVTGGLAKQTHFVEYTVTVRVIKTQPAEELLCQFQRTRRFNEFSSFRKALLDAYPSLLTTAHFPGKTWTRGGSKSSSTIKERILWFKEWLRELLDPDMTKGVTNPAMISAMTAHWLYGDTETDKTLNKIESRKSFNPDTDEIASELTANEKKQHTDTLWNVLKTSKEKYHDELNATMNAHIVDANQRYRASLEFEKTSYERHETTLKSGWTVKKYSLAKNLMGNKKVQSRVVWIVQDNAVGDSSGEVKTSETSSSSSSNSSSSSSGSGWSVRWCEPKKRTNKNKVIGTCTKMTITSITRDLKRGFNFVLIKTPGRMVEFEFAEKDEVDTLMECWHYVCIFYNQTMSLLRSLLTFEELGCRFIQTWKNIDVDMLMIEDKWFLHNGANTQGKVDADCGALITQRCEYNNVVSRWSNMPLHSLLVGRLHDIALVGNEGTEMLLRLLDDKLLQGDSSAVAVGRSRSGSLVKKRLRLSEYTKGFVNFAYTFRSLLRECASGVGGVVSLHNQPKGTDVEWEVRRRRMWSDISSNIIRSIATVVGERMNEKAKYILDGHLSTLSLSFEWSKWFDSAFDVEVKGIDEVGGEKLDTWWLDLFRETKNIIHAQKGKQAMLEVDEEEEDTVPVDLA